MIDENENEQPVVEPAETEQVLEDRMADLDEKKFNQLPKDTSGEEPPPIPANAPLPSPWL